MPVSAGRKIRTVVRKGVQKKVRKASAKRVKMRGKGGSLFLPQPGGPRGGNGPLLPPQPGFPRGPVDAPTGGGGGGQGNIPAICQGLSGIARIICLAGERFLPDGPTGGGGGGGGGRGGGDGIPFFPTDQPTGGDCPPGQFRVPFIGCVDIGEAAPGGEPLFPEGPGAGGRTVEGAFGMPAITPVIERRIHRNCPKGMVLGRDNLCYPKQVLSRRNKNRKWRQPPRPKISHADSKAINKAENLKDKLKDLTRKHPGLKTARNK